MMISSFVNKLSDCSLSRGSTLILVIWYPWSSDCHFSPFSIPACLCTPLFYMEQTVILQMFMQTKRFLVSHFEDLRETYCKAFQREKKFVLQKEILFYSTFGKCHFSHLVMEWLSVLFLVPCIVYIQRTEESTYLSAFSLFLK